MLGDQEHEVNKYVGLDICGNATEQGRDLNTGANCTTTTHISNGDLYDSSCQEQADPTNPNHPTSSDLNSQTLLPHCPSYDVQSHSTPGPPQPTAQTSSALLSTAWLLSATEPSISLFLMRLASSDLALVVIATWLGLNNPTGDSVSDVLSATTDYVREMHAAAAVLLELVASEEAIAGILHRIEHDPQFDLHRALTAIGDHLFYDLNNAAIGSIMYTVAGDADTVHGILAIMPESKETRNLPECVRQMLLATASYLSHIDVCTAETLDETAGARHADNDVDKSELDTLPPVTTESLPLGMALDRSVDEMAAEQNTVSQTQQYPNPTNHTSEASLSGTIQLSWWEQVGLQPQQSYLDLDNPGEAFQGNLDSDDSSARLLLYQGILHSQQDQGKELPSCLTAETPFQQHVLQSQQSHLDSNDSLTGFVNKLSLQQSVLQIHQDYVDHDDMSSSSSSLGFVTELLSQQDDLQPQPNCLNYDGFSSGSTLLDSAYELPQDHLDVQQQLGCLENANFIPECPPLSIMTGLTNTQPQQSNPDSLNFVEESSLSDIPAESLWDQVEWLPQQGHSGIRNFAVDSSTSSTISEPSNHLASNQHIHPPTFPASNLAPSFPTTSQPLVFHYDSPAANEARVCRYHNAQSVLSRLWNGDPHITDPVAGMYVLGQALAPVMTSWNLAPRWIDGDDKTLEEVKALILGLRRKLMNRYTLGSNGSDEDDQRETGLLRSRRHLSRAKKDQMGIGPLRPRHRLADRKGNDPNSGPLRRCSPRHAIATPTTPTMSCSNRGPNWPKLLQRTLLDFWLQNDGRHPGPEDREELLQVTGLKSRQLTDWYGRTCQRRGNDLERYRVWSRQYPDKVYDWESYTAFKSEVDGRGKMGRKKRKTS